MKSTESNVPFEAVNLPGDGWVILTPWVITPDGQRYRAHVECDNRDEESAKHLAAQLNIFLRP